MAYLTVDKNGDETVWEQKPIRGSGDANEYSWVSNDCDVCSGMGCSGLENQVTIPRGSIKKLIRKDLAWEDEPYGLW